MDAEGENVLTNRHSYSLLKTWKQIRVRDAKTSNWQHGSGWQLLLHKGLPTAVSKQLFSGALTKDDCRMQVVTKWMSSREFQTAPHK